MECLHQIDDLSRPGEAITMMDVETPVAELKDLDLTLDQFEGLLRTQEWLRLECVKEGGTFRRWHVHSCDPHSNEEDLGYIEVFEFKKRLSVTFRHPYYHRPPARKGSEGPDEDYPWEYLDWSEAGMICASFADDIKHMLQARGILSETDDQGDVAKQKRPKWFPKKESTIDKWRQAYRLCCALEKEYKELYVDGYVHDPKPNWHEHSEHIAGEIGWKIRCRKTINRILKAGKDDFLK
jgi:hypothetical protein